MSEKKNSCWRAFARQREHYGKFRWLCTKCHKHYARRASCCGAECVAITQNEARVLGKLKGRADRVAELVRQLQAAAKAHHEGRNVMMRPK